MRAAGVGTMAAVVVGILADNPVLGIGCGLIVAGYLTVVDVCGRH